MKRLLKKRTLLLSWYTVVSHLHCNDTDRMWNMYQYTGDAFRQLRVKRVELYIEMTCSYTLLPLKGRVILLANGWTTGLVSS